MVRGWQLLCKMENQIGSHIHITKVNLNLVKNYIGLIFYCHSLLFISGSHGVTIHGPQWTDAAGAAGLGSIQYGYFKLA